MIDPPLSDVANGRSFPRYFVIQPRAQQSSNNTIFLERIFAFSLTFQRLRCLTTVPQTLAIVAIGGTLAPPPVHRCHMTPDGKVRLVFHSCERHVKGAMLRSTKPQAEECTRKPMQTIAHHMSRWQPRPCPLPQSEPNTLITPTSMSPPAAGTLTTEPTSQRTSCPVLTSPTHPSFPGSPSLTGIAMFPLPPPSVQQSKSLLATSSTNQQTQSQTSCPIAPPSHRCARIRSLR